MTYVLHERLAADTLPAGLLDLCELRLMNDERFVWALLVPQRASIRESFELAAQERAQLWEEVDRLGAFMMQETGAAKLNIGALGNIVPQLHVHLIARHEGDEAWPGPVWGAGHARPLNDAQKAQRLDMLGRFVQQPR